jgi:DNA-binding MarR family transcriptional regulator
VSAPPDLLKLENQLCFPLYAASRLITQAYRPHLEALGLTYVQYLVLLVLWEKNSQTVSELGSRLLLDSGTLTPVLKRLEKLGTISRERSSTDERRVECTLTKAGKRLRARAKAIPLAMLEDIGLTLEEAVKLKTDVCDLVARLEQRAAGTGWD